MPEPRQELASHEAMSLLQGLTAAYQKGSATRIATGEMGLLEALKSPNPDVFAKATIQIHELADKLNGLVVKDGRFPGSNVRMIRGDGGAAGFYPTFVGVPLVRRALQTGSPEAAIKWLRKVLATTAATGKTIHALWGVPVDREIHLTPDVKIVPIDELPNSVQKQWIAGYSNFQDSSPVMTVLNFEPLSRPWW